MHSSRAVSNLALSIVGWAAIACGSGGGGGDATGPPVDPPSAPPAVAKILGDNQQARAGATLDQVLRVSVKDASNKPVVAATVTFTVTSGGGTIQGSPTSTNGEGIASSGQWTLGPGTADQTVSASSGSATVVFTAQPDSCPATTVAIGVPVAATLATGDCVLSGALADRYELATPAARALAISVTSAAFTPRLVVRGMGGAPIASDDQVGMAETTYCVFDSPPTDGCHTPSTSPSGSPIVLFAASGSRLFTAASKEAQGAGAYTLAVDETSSSISGCRTRFIERGVTTTQQLEATDCGVLFGASVLYYSDDIKIYLTAGSQLQVTMSSSDFTPWLDFFSPAGLHVSSCVNPGTAVCTFDILSDGYYLLAPSSFEQKRPGAYTLSVK